MKLFTTEDLARQFIDEVDRIEGGKDSDAKKRADLSGKAKAYAFLFDLALNGVQVVGAREESGEDDEEIDDPALDPENEYCSCGNRTENFPVICSQCSYMSSLD